MAESKKSTFSLTCSRLSQFLREKRSFADLAAIDIVTSNPQEPINGFHRMPTTLNLLPGLDISAETETETADTGCISDRNVIKELENKPLTIFYGGKVMIFDNFSPEKASDLMNLATRGSTKLNTSDVPMPMARRASLHRFLEKRKNRINSKAPYQMNGLSKTQEAKSWLGLGQEISKQ